MHEEGKSSLSLRRHDTPPRCHVNHYACFFFAFGFFPALLAILSAG
jgi:hypothetical protein